MTQLAQSWGFVWNHWGKRHPLSGGLLSWWVVVEEQEGPVLLPHRENLRDGKIPEHLDPVVPETLLLDFLAPHSHF